MGGGQFFHVKVGKGVRVYVSVLVHAHMSVWLYLNPFLCSCGRHARGMTHHGFAKAKGSFLIS